jgi:hypothetical protein
MIVTYMHQIYNNGLLKLKNMDWFASLFVPLYACIFVYEFYLGYIIRCQYMIYLEKKNICAKTLDFWMT